MKNSSKIFLSVAILFLVAISNISAQMAELPKVFMIGEYESSYEQLFVQCDSPLLSVCDNSMSKAYDEWSNMLSSIEEFSLKSDFDLKGIKVWINVFWNENGTVKNIVYYPKPNSRNMDFGELTNFLTDFVVDYQFELKGENCFNHYGSASFPTYSKGIKAQAK